MKVPSKAKVKKYVAGASVCLFCGSDNIAGGEIDFNDDRIYQKVACYDCGQEWEDVYNMVGVFIPFSGDEIIPYKVKEIV